MFRSWRLNPDKEKSMRALVLLLLMALALPVKAASHVLENGFVAGSTAIVRLRRPSLGFRAARRRMRCAP